MNKAISRIFIVGVVLFVALIVNLTWIMAGGPSGSPTGPRTSAASPRR